MARDITAAFESSRIIAICRKIYGEDLKRLAGAIYGGGIRMIEVTFDQSDPDCLKKTSESIQMISSDYPDMFVGCGTVLNLDQVKAAHTAGGTFIVSPNTNLGVISLTKSLGMMSFPGAMTPSEIVSAHDAGADYVKLFPAGNLGPAYVKAIRSPLNHIKLVMVGGVSAENLADFLNAGAYGAGIGGKLCDKKLIEAGQFDQIEALAHSLTEIVKENVH